MALRILDIDKALEKTIYKAYKLLVYNIIFVKDI